jgi:hypothetical protein
VRESLVKVPSLFAVLILVLLILLSPPGNRTSLNWHEPATFKMATMHIHDQSLRFVEQIRRICLEAVAVSKTWTRRSKSACIPHRLAGSALPSLPRQRSQLYAPGVPLEVEVMEMPLKADITSRELQSDPFRPRKVAPYWLRLPIPKQ